MGRFLVQEKRRLAIFKQISPYFSAAARADGLYHHRWRPFCLPLECAQENLYPGIREAALAYWEAQNITWHDGHAGLPSNHLCDSQVCCVNLLFPLADQPGALADMLRPLYPGLREMLPVEAGQYVAFEWIGDKNYLGEGAISNRRRTRGANCTSADAAVLFSRNDRIRQMVLIEFKYTESYGQTSLAVSRGGTDRTSIYAPLFEHDDGPLDRGRVPGFADLFYEPFYQFMRQQFLAHEMEQAHELGADAVSVLHIAPEHNGEFQRVTSPGLVPLGDKATNVWASLLRTPGRFLSVSSERLFGGLAFAEYPALYPWLIYIRARYPWLHDEDGPHR
jgi:hypothetical protein